MHGIIHAELKRFVVTNYDQRTWLKLLKTAQLDHKYYLIGESYPDADALKIVSTACEMTGLSAAQLLEAFGLFIVPSLLKLYGSLVRPEWRTLDFLLNTEQTIHRVVRMKNKGALPPELQFELTRPNELRFTYTSSRGMADLAVGIIRGVAQHYAEQVVIVPMERSATKSVFEIRVVGPLS